ncbi:MAG: GNAT family N-acetyltransferase [Agriterribacter sp.]
MDTNRWTREAYFISIDKALLNITYIHNYLCNEAYWCKGIPIEIVKKSIENSTCFGVYKNDQQVGFARAITDKATFGYIGDVFIDADYRGQGLSKWLVQTILDYPQFQGFRNWMLVTQDAHGLYEQFGFVIHPQPERVMRKNDPSCYGK